MALGSREKVQLSYVYSDDDSLQDLTEFLEHVQRRTRPQLAGENCYLCPESLQPVSRLNIRERQVSSFATNSTPFLLKSLNRERWEGLVRGPGLDPLWTFRL